MSIIEEKGRVISVEGDFARISTDSQSSCDSCESKAGCGTSLLKPLFNSKKPLLIAKNVAGAAAGDSVIIGLESMAIVLSSLLIYLFPLLMLIAGAAIGEYFASSSGIEMIEIVSILTGLMCVFLAFYISRIFLRSHFFKAICQPVVLRLN